MAYPNTPSERQSIADGWRPENDPHGAAHIWKIEADRKFLRYEAEYCVLSQIWNDVVASVEQVRELLR